MKFYSVDMKKNKDYTIIMGLYRNDIKFSLNFTFLKYQEKHGIKYNTIENSHILFVIKENQVLKFENFLTSKNIKFVLLNITDDEYATIDNKIKEERKNKRILNEQLLTPSKFTYRIIMNTDEMCNHNRPHVCVETNGKDGRAIITIDDKIEIIKDNRKSNKKALKRALKEIENKIQEYRKTWNETTKSVYKFDYIDGKYISKK